MWIDNILQGNSEKDDSKVLKTELMPQSRDSKNIPTGTKRDSLQETIKTKTNISQTENQELIKYENKRRKKTNNMNTSEDKLR